MDVERYARFYAAMEGKDPRETDAVLASLGETQATLAVARRAFDKRLEHDKKLRAEMGVRVLIERGRSARALLPPPAPARLIRSLPCFRCGGYKRTEPRTAYVYCDYCGGLFDYEQTRAIRTTGLDDSTVFNLLVDGVREEIRSAFAAKDDHAYRAAWRWPYEMDMLLFPDAWSPRARDPEYRNRMVDFSVETCVLQNRPKLKAKRAPLVERAAHAQETLRRQPSDRAITAYVASLQECLAAQAAEFQQAGVFALHPDKLDEASYVRINVALQVFEWRTQLPPKRFDALLAVAKVKATHVDVAPAGTHQASCGHCGGKLLVVEGAQKLVCEACGHELGASASVACPTCGARVLISAGRNASKCAWCESVIQVVS